MWTKTSKKAALVIGLEVNNSSYACGPGTLRSKEKKEIKAKKVSCMSLSKAKIIHALTTYMLYIEQRGEDKMSSYQGPGEKRNGGMAE